MGISIMKWILGTPSTSRLEEITCRELAEAAEEYRTRDLAFWSCVNLIANAIGRCDFRTFVNWNEAKGREYYLWNVEPNTNQNSTAFLHKMVAMLYKENEVLIVPTRKKDGTDALVVADSWQPSTEFPSRQNEYTGVSVGQFSYDKTFRERDVLHLTLNYCNIKPVIDGLYQSYMKLLKVAMQNYTWSNGQHWKVTVNQMATGQDNWLETFQKVIEQQIRPFLNSGSAILPEYNGWKYENVSKNTDDQKDASQIRSLITDIFDFTANAFLIPPVLLQGQVQGTSDAWRRFMTNCVDPLADQLSEEINRKRYGYEALITGNYLKVDTSAIEHFNLFDHAANIEKLIGSGYSYNDVQKAIGGQEIKEPWAYEHFVTKNFDLAKNILKGESSRETDVGTKTAD